MNKPSSSPAESILFTADMTGTVRPGPHAQGVHDEHFHLAAPERSQALGSLSPNRKTRGYWISAWWPVALGICVIALESTAPFGSDHTSGPLRWVWEHIVGQVTNQRWEILHHYIRKTGHFVGYGTMGLLWLRALWMSLPKTSFFLDAILALLGTAMVASADEFHQSFLPNRTGVPSDVLLDCCGAVVLLFLTYLFLRLRSPKRLSRAA